MGNVIFLSQLGAVDTYLGELTLVEVPTLCWLLPVFPRFVCRPWSELGIQQFSLWLPETIEKEK